MKEKLLKALPLICALLLGLMCVWCFFVYASPMENVSLDLSLITDEEGPGFDRDNFDAKGWLVYTQDGETVTELTPNGLGGYNGLELGQTFYLSRIMEEDLDSPTLQIRPVEYTFSVWLDDMLIYTDCPELDNRIGYVSLPMNDQYRSESITISLPMDYQGKTLTIAQAFPEWTETGTVTAWPANMTLYCGYAYESELISETFQTTVLACIGFLITAVLLIAFVRSRDWRILCIALAAGLWMVWQLVTASYFPKYFGGFENSPMTLIPDMIALSLLIFMILRGGSHRKLLWPLAGLSALSIAAVFVVLTVQPRQYASNIFLWHLDAVIYWLLFATMVAVMVLAVLFWRKQNWFYRVFTPMALSAMTVLVAVNAVLDGSGLLRRITDNLNNGQIKYILYLLLPAVVLSAVVTTIVESVKMELDRRAEQQMMEQRRELALESYENLRRQHEEVMMIRHDMLRHFRTLHDMDGDERRTAYLAELIGQNEKVRPVVDSGNEMLDIILNGRLSAATDAGIRVELPHISAPEKLPLSDPDLCALFLNLVDNAIAAASAAEDPFLLMKIHEKDDHLALVCENSFDPQEAETETIKETVPQHGLGLKIVSNIVEKYHGAILTERSEDRFSVKIVLPLDAD